MFEHILSERRGDKAARDIDAPNRQIVSSGVKVFACAMERHDEASYEARAAAAASEELIIARDTAALSEGAHTREMAASSARMAVRQGAVDDEVTRLLACEAESDRCGRGLVGSFALLLLLGRALRLAAAARRIRDAVRQRFRIKMLV